MIRTIQVFSTTFHLIPPKQEGRWEARPKWPKSCDVTLKEDPWDLSVITISRSSWSVRRKRWRRRTRRWVASSFELFSSASFILSLAPLVAGWQVLSPKITIIWTHEKAQALLLSLTGHVYHRQLNILFPQGVRILDVWKISFWQRWNSKELFCNFYNPVK